MDTSISIDDRAAAAATAVERLARALTIADAGRVSPVAAAYLLRLGEAAARVAEEAAPLLSGVDPAPVVWRPALDTSAGRQP